MSADKPTPGTATGPACCCRDCFHLQFNGKHPPSRGRWRRADVWCNRVFGPFENLDHRHCCGDFAPATQGSY